MFHLSLYNQIYPIIIQQPQSYALSLRANQVQCQPPKPVHNKKKKSKSVNKSISNSKQTEAQRTALKAGLQKSLDATNKGFNILKRMGYEEGKPLGKDGSGIIEPLTIPIKDNPHDRAGLGQEPKKTVVIKKESIETEVKVKTNTIKTEKPIKPEPSIATTRREKRLLQLSADYHDDIELLRLRLQAELSVKTRSRDTMIIAQVTINGEPICRKLFEIIHQYLVNSLHVYKAAPFPMFHDITHVDNKIKVVCEDNPSFEYLATCITALGSNLATEMTTTRVSPVGSNVFWFAVQMEGLVCGPQSFLLQIKKHRFDLHPDRWIIVSQTPMAKTNKTHLQIITDEHSAMLLMFRHNLKLFVCMQPMVFLFRGKIPFFN